MGKGTYSPSLWRLRQREHCFRSSRNGEAIFSAAEDEIGGYQVPADTEILLCPYITHRHPESWDNREGFDPGLDLPLLIDTNEYEYLNRYASRLLFRSQTRRLAFLISSSAHFISV